MIPVICLMLVGFALLLLAVALYLTTQKTIKKEQQDTERYLDA